jgi:hypothetical protein
MKTSRNVRSVLVFSGILAGVVGAFVACGDGGGDGTVNGYDPNHPPGSTNKEGGANGEGGSGTPGVDPAEALYRGLEKDLIGKCGGPGGGCHVSATAFATAPKFLAAPDSYKSIKAYQGIVVKDVFTSSLVTKGVHEGGSIYDDVTGTDGGLPLGKRVEAWLYQESTELQAIKRPSTDPFAVTIGADNDVDLSKVATGVTGVHLKFKAQLIGTTLELTNVSLSTAAGTAVHLQHPIFYRVPATKANPADPDTQDPQDTFSNTDVTVGGGAVTPLPVPFAIFSGFDPWQKTDKLRIEVYKLEPGKVPEASTTAMCSNPANFGTMVAPLLKGMGNSSLNCAAGGCHGNGGNGQGALNLAGLANNDNAGACAAVLNKIDTATPANSKIIAKPATAGVSHAGGKVANPTAYTTDFTGFISGKQIF